MFVSLTWRKGCNKHIVPGNVLSYQMTQKEKQYGHFYFSVTLGNISINVSIKIKTLKSFTKPEYTRGVAWPSVRSPVPGDAQRGEQVHSKCSHTAHCCPPLRDEPLQLPPHPQHHRGWCAEKRTWPSIPVWVCYFGTGKTQCPFAHGKH